MRAADAGDVKQPQPRPVGGGGWVRSSHARRARSRRDPFAGQKKDGGPKPAVQYHVAVESAVDQNFAWRPKNT
jgi:hypothetical protein